MSAYSTAILASDFSESTTDTLRQRWTTGKMRHVVAALDGALVAITTDRQTGHTEVGVRLTRVTSSGQVHSGPRVEVERTLPNGSTQRTLFRLDEVGEAIIPLDEGFSTGVKWVAIKAYRDEGSAAIRIAREEHGEAEGRAWGKWSASPNLESVSVRYEPLTANPAFADQWGTRWFCEISLQQIATTLGRRAVAR